VERSVNHGDMTAMLVAGFDLQWIDVRRLFGCSAKSQ
jgi:hypothetical protein